MTNNFPRVTAILSRIPDAATRWPGWFWPTCPECGEECEYDATKDPFCHNPDCHVHFEKITPAYRFAPPTDGDGQDVWHGNDLDPRNMHHLWEMLRAVDRFNEPRLMVRTAGVWTSEITSHTGTGANIIEAMLRCLEAAVGVVEPADPHTPKP